MPESINSLPNGQIDATLAVLDDAERSRIRTELGSRVKSLRIGEGLTLEQASEKTGLAVSTIHKVENGRVSPSFENLLRLARGYGVGLEKLIESPSEEVNTTRLTVTRAGEGRAIGGKTYDYEILCNGLTGKKIIPLIARIGPRGPLTDDTLDQHTGEELLFVLEGEIELKVEHYETVILKAGDCAYYDSTMRHGIRSLSPQVARVLWACTHIHGLS